MKFRNSFYWRFRILIVWIFIIAIPVYSYTQVETIMSLSDQIESSPENPSKVDLLNQLTFRYLDLNQLEAGLKSGNTSLELATDLKYEKGRAEAYKNIGLHAYYSNQFKLSINQYKNSLHIYDYLDDSAHMAKLLNEIGRVYRDMTFYDTALIYLYRSRQILSSIRDSAGLAETLNRIGRVYDTKGELERSLENFMESIQICQETGDQVCMSLAYCHMGSVYRKLSDSVRAAEYLEKALELNKLAGPTRGIVDIYLQLGMLYKSNSSFPEAILMFKKSLNLARYYNNQRKIAECLNNIGAVYHDMLDYGTALGFYKRALKIQNDLGINHGIVQTTTNMARAFLDMVEARRSGAFNDFDVAIDSEDEIFELLNYSVVMARESGNFFDLVSTYEALIRGSVIFKRYGDGVGYQNQLIQYKDSVAGINRQQSVAELQADFEMKQQELEIALLNSNNKIQESEMEQSRLERYFYLGGGLSLLLLIIGLFNRLKFTNRTRAEMQQNSLLIEEEKRRAEQSENVREQFLSKMSHEIRIPMNTIMGSVNIILNGEHQKSQVKYLKAIYQSSENLMVIIDDILDLTKLQAGKVKLDMAPFSIRGEVENVMQILRFKASEKGIGFVTHVDEQVPEYLMGDSTRLSQILINLAGNGIKFTEKGQVSIDISLKAKDKTNAILLAKVKDTGIGIPQDRLDKIFRSFTQADNDTNRKYGGTGLGLTISKQLVELQNGEIYVLSQPGEGSEFSFEVPYGLVLKESNIKKDGLSKGAQKMTDLKILVVEDDEFNVMVLKDTLSTSISGVQVDVAGDGSKALQMWEGGNYDVILMDIELPVKNGHEVTREIRSSSMADSDIPIIAMTANAMHKEVEACFESGMNDFVAKPFDPEELILKISSHLINKNKG